MYRRWRDSNKNLFEEPGANRLISDRMLTKGSE